jgi:hypothetical protein
MSSNIRCCRSISQAVILWAKEGLRAIIGNSRMNRAD